MINTIVVDKSPSVKWEDVGKISGLSVVICEYYTYFTLCSIVVESFCYLTLFSAGLDKAKQTLFEMVILPSKRRDLFTGLRRPPRGIVF